ncbi:MAG: T9SS type A sorting domain-containing protein [Bacteroidetes bacterium]|nr:T9SS type A sorting domain-containing protein [Bacteroidota bacterium]
MKTIVIFFSIIFTFSVFAQDSLWPIVYENNIVHEIIKPYDNGLLIVGVDCVLSGEGYGMIKKTDINGVTLWQINVDYKPTWSGTHVNAISQTNDGGYIASGFTRMFGNGRPFIIKFNTCFEKEWSKVFIFNDTVRSAKEIYQLESGNYLMRVTSESLEKSDWVYKLSPMGNIIWQKYYADDWEPGPWSNERTRAFVPDNNGDFIISGEYYIAQPGYDTNSRWLRPMFIKIDTAGNELWHMVYGLDDFYIGLTMGTTTASNGIIYSTGYYDGYNTPGRPPAVYKIDATGDTLLYTWLHNQNDSTVFGRANDISVMNDTALFVIAGWYNYVDTSYFAFKLDTSLNVKKRAVLKRHQSYFPGRSLITSDNNYVAVSYMFNEENTSFDMHLWKLNSNLEFDTLYTQPFNYDSLCPYQIVSDTIELDTTTVNLDELAKNIVPMSIYPNPAKNNVRLEINIVKMKVRKLVVLNLQGQQVYNATISPGRANHNIDVSSWEDGLYVFRLSENNTLLQTEKVLVVK